MYIHVLIYVHCTYICMCMYLMFIVTRLKQVDIEFMKQLHEKVNVIPVIAKADTLTPEECARFKKTVGLTPYPHPLRQPSYSLPISVSLSLSPSLPPSLPFPPPPSLPPSLPPSPPSQIMNEIVENGIKIYQFPDSDGDEEEAAANKRLRVSFSSCHVTFLWSHVTLLLSHRVT